MHIGVYFLENHIRYVIKIFKTNIPISNKNENTIIYIIL